MNRKRRNSFDRSKTRSEHKNNNDQPHYEDPKKRFRNHSRSKSNTKENFEESLRLNVKHRLTINENSNGSEHSLTCNEADFNCFKKTGLRITIDNDKYLYNNDNNNNNNMICNMNNQFQNKIQNQLPSTQFNHVPMPLMPQIALLPHPIKSNVHSRIQSIPTFLNVPQIPPFPVVQPLFIQQTKTTRLHKSAYHNNNNITIDSNSQFKVFNNRNTKIPSESSNSRIEKQNTYWNGSTNNTKNNNLSYVKVQSNNVAVAASSNNFVRPSTLNLNQQIMINDEVWEDDNKNKLKSFENLKTPPNLPTTNLSINQNANKNNNSSSTPKEKYLNNSLTNGFKPLQKKQIFNDYEMWDDEFVESTKTVNTADSITKSKTVFTNQLASKSSNQVLQRPTNLKCKNDEEQHKSSKQNSIKFDYTDLDAPLHLAKNGMYFFFSFF